MSKLPFTKNCLIVLISLFISIAQFTYAEINAEDESTQSKLAGATATADGLGTIWYSEHKKNKSPSNWDQHTKKRPGAPEKKDNKPGWKDNSNKRKS